MGERKKKVRKEIEEFYGRNFGLKGLRKSSLSWGAGTIFNSTGAQNSSTNEGQICFSESQRRKKWFLGVGIFCKLGCKIHPVIQRGQSCFPLRVANIDFKGAQFF